MAQIRRILRCLENGKNLRLYVPCALDLIGVIPVIGALKYSDEIGTLFKMRIKSINGGRKYR